VSGPDSGSPARICQSGLYLAFAGFRARPVEDLLARIDLRDVRGPIWDIGCGAGNVTAMLAAKWPDRAVTGLDSSPAMLAEARKKFPAMRWEHGDIAAWMPPDPPALIFANASLHWVPDHPVLFPRLIRSLQPGGWLAVQMPNTADAPYRACLDTVLAQAPWHIRLKEVATHPDPLAAADYYAVAAGAAAAVDIWETHYIHALESVDAVVDWVSGAALVPYLSVLSEAERDRFCADYRDAAEAVYRPQPDGRVLFTMRRVFVLARRAA
jgi:trans-aconitate 2-methyltransferase